MLLNAKKDQSLIQRIYASDPSSLKVALLMLLNKHVRLVITVLKKNYSDYKLEDTGLCTFDPKSP